jgi:hypothetical protein
MGIFMAEGIALPVEVINHMFDIKEEVIEEKDMIR